MQFQSNVSLRAYNSFGIEARAEHFGAFRSLGELSSALERVKESRAPLLVLGGGSNVLLTRDLPGYVLRNEITGVEKVNETDDHVFLRTGAGENWHRFVMHCVEAGYAGVENLALIPGSNGASPMQNIGAYGVEIKDVFHELEAILIEDGSLHRFSLNDCAFGYRESVFKRRYKSQFIITSVTYRLSRKPVFHTGYGAIQQELDKMGVQDLSIKAIAEAVIRIRSSKLPDPAEVGNAGSFFKNPMVQKDVWQAIMSAYPDVPSFPGSDDTVKIPAGWLIEQCGWKGYRKGDAGCYPKQALVLVNYGKATGKEIYDLSEDILQSVKAKFNVQLEREVNII